MAVVIFALGIKSTNGLVKSTINTANSLVKSGVDTTIINIVGKIGGIDFLDQAFPLLPDINRYSLDMMKVNCTNEIELKNRLFYSINQKYLNAKYTEYHRLVLQEVNSKLTEDDLIIFTHPLAMIVYEKANPNSKVKKLIQVHGNYLEEIDNFKLLEEYFDKVDYIQAVSKYMKDDLINILHTPKDKTIYIPNITVPIQLEKIYPKYLKRVSIIGSIQKRKNQYDAIKMIELIEDNNVILHVYGNPLDKEYTHFIKEYVYRKGLSHRVIFKGVASEYDIYSNSDIVILPSIHEGFGYTFLESALYGIPTVAYDFKYGASEFLVKVENDTLIPMGDYKLMAEKVSNLLNNQELYNNVVQQNIEHFKKEYSEKRIVKQYIDLLGNRDKKVNFYEMSIVSNQEPLMFKYIEQKEKNLNIFPKKIERNIKLFYNYLFEVEGNIEGLKLYYLYKNRSFPIKYNKLNSDDKQLISFKIFQRNRLSGIRRIKGFFLYAVDKNHKKYYMGYLSKKENFEVLYHYKNMYPNKIGKFDISKFNHTLDSSGFFIQYPMAEAIKIIEDIDGNRIDFETKVIKVNGEYLPTFKLKGGIYSSIILKLNSGKETQIDFSRFSFGTFFKKFEEIELKYDLYEKSIEGIFFWELIRANLFEIILEATGVLDKAFTKKSENRAYSYTYKKSIWDIKECNRLILEFPRKKEKDYRTHAFQGEKFDEIILEYPQKDGYTDRVYDASSNVYPMEKFLHHMEKYRAFINYTEEDRDLIRELNKIFIAEIGININFLSFIDGRIKKFKREFAFFDKFFKEKDIKEILIPSSYWSAGVVEAANKNGVISSDIQYALISHIHPSFSFPTKRHYATQQGYLWSDYWNISSLSFKEYFISKTNYFIEKIKELDLTPNMPIEHDVVFASQSRIGCKFFEWVYSFSLQNPNIRVVFCPHPDEEVRNYKNYWDFVKLSNSRVSQKDTLVEVAHSRIVVGVYSTTLYEALALGKSVFVTNISGYEVLQKEIDKGYFTFIKSKEDLGKILSTASLNKEVNFAKLFYNYLEK